MFAIEVFSCNRCLRATVETRHDVAIGGQSRNLPTGRDKGTNDVPLNFKGLELLSAFSPRFSTTSFYLSCQYSGLFSHLAGIVFHPIYILHIACFGELDSSYHMFISSSVTPSCNKQRSRARLGLERVPHASHFYLGPGRRVTQRRCARFDSLISRRQILFEVVLCRYVSCQLRASGPGGLRAP